MPVPTAVAPRFTSRNSAERSPRRANILLDGDREGVELLAERHRTASWSWVRPLLTMSAKSTALVRKAKDRSPSARTSGAVARMMAKRSAVG